MIDSASDSHGEPIEMPDEWANDAYLWLSAMCQAYVKAGGTEVSSESFTWRSFIHQTSFIR